MAIKMVYRNKKPVDGYSYELKQAKISGIFSVQPVEIGASM